MCCVRLTVQDHVQILHQLKMCVHFTPKLKYLSLVNFIGDNCCHSSSAKQAALQLILLLLQINGCGLYDLYILLLPGN